MTEEIKTKIVFEAEARGFDAVQKVIDGVTGDAQGSKRGGRSNSQEAVASLLGSNRSNPLAQLDRALASIASNATKLQTAIAAINTGAAAFRQTVGPMRQGGGGGGQGGGSGPPRRDERMDPGFLRGILQGLGVAQYLPGATTGALAAQAGGVLAGRTVAGVGGGVFHSAFSGIGALAQGISAIPGLGPVTAGLTMNSASAVEDALRLQEASLGARPYLNQRGASRAGRAAAAAVGRGMGPDQAEEFARSAGIDAFSQEFRSQQGNVDGHPVDARRRVEYLRRSTFLQGAELERAIKQATGEDNPEGVLSSATRAQQDAEVGARGDFSARRVRQMRAAAEAARGRALYGSDEATGAHHGLNLIQTRQHITALTQARGGFFDPSGGALQGALAAQTGFGINAQTSGALLRGARNGAMQGGSSEGDTIAQAIGHATAMSLEGSDIGTHLGRMATGIQRFESTGIPLASSATSAIARSLIHAGVAPSVAASRANAFTSAVQQRAYEGLPTNSVDFAALVRLGGYKGGGSEDALSARARMIRGDFAPGGLDALTRDFAGQLGSGPNGRSFGVEMGFRRLGLAMGPDVASALDTRSTGGRLSKAQEDAIAGWEARARKGPQNLEELEGEAGQAPGGLQRRAGIGNKRIHGGEVAMSAVQDFEERAAKAAAAFSTVVDKLRILNPVLDGFEGALEHIIQLITGKPVLQSGG